MTNDNDTIAFLGMVLHRTNDRQWAAHISEYPKLIDVYVHRDADRPVIRASVRSRSIDASSTEHEVQIGLASAADVTDAWLRSAAINTPSLHAEMLGRMVTEKAA
jgi:hypothetical protein